MWHPSTRGLSMAWLLLALAAALEAGGSPSAARQQQPPAAPADQQKPTFRAAVNFVRVDVYPRANGRSIDNLTRADFELREDGVAQEIAAFEHIAIRGGVPADQRVDPRNVRESRELAADARNRVFVLFLDSFHVTDPAAMHNARARTPGSTVERMPATRRLAPPTWIDRALTTFLQRTVGPDDLIAAMTPEMDTRELTFVRRPEAIEAFLKTTWARRFSLDELDPEQESFFRCYPPDDPKHRYDGIAEEMVVRHRELLTIQALRNLVLHLGELRDERKGVLLISEGWALFRPNQQLARQLPTAPPPQAPGIYPARAANSPPGSIRVSGATGQPGMSASGRASGWPTSTTSKRTWRCSTRRTVRMPASMPLTLAASRSSIRQSTIAGSTRRRTRTPPRSAARGR